LIPSFWQLLFEKKWRRQLTGILHDEPYFRKLPVAFWGVYVGRKKENDRVDNWRARSASSGSNITEESSWTEPPTSLCSAIYISWRDEQLCQLCCGLLLIQILLKAREDLTDLFRLAQIRHSIGDGVMVLEAE
jgi:hypothetical protein